jgi:hypothetical protein
MLWRKQFLNLTLLSVATTLTLAQGSSASPERTCTSSSVASVPSRPTVTNATDTTQCGVVEIEYGLERQWPGGGANRDDLTGGLRMGLTHNLDFHWASADFLHVVDGTGDRTGFGDSWLGLRYRFLEQGKYRPSLGLSYQAKVPSANTALGLGSGQVDHALSLLVSKDLHPFHVDFNVTPLFAGRQSASGVDHNIGFALSSSTPITKRLGMVAEGYGYTSLNAENPAFASTMIGFTYQVNPRLFLDSGIDVGVTKDAPHKRVYLGVTYAIANVYSWMKSR